MSTLTKNELMTHHDKPIFYIMEIAAIQAAYGISWFIKDASPLQATVLVITGVYTLMRAIGLVWRWVSSCRKHKQEGRTNVDQG